MHEAHGMVQIGVHLTLKDAFEIRLHFSTGHIDNDGQVHGSAGLGLIDVRTDEFDFAVFDLIQVAHSQVLEGGGVFSAELDVHIFATDAFTLECGSVGNRNIDLFYLDLDTADLDTTGD